MIKLNKEQVLKLHIQLMEATGGSHGIRDEKLLDSALNVPFQSFGGEELYPSIQAKAAQLCFGLVKNHAKIGGVLVKEVLFVGFRGKNNTSSQLVSLLPTPHKKLLTNSFSGLYKDIERIQTEKYASVIMFGIDKGLKDCVRIEQIAAYNGEWKHSSYPIADLAEGLAGADIKYEVSSTPTKYLCNAAYFYMLNKCSNSVFIHIPSLRGITSVLLQQLQDAFSCPCFCPCGNS